MSIVIDLKTQKYDRQLRLWATTGQQALEHANICLLNVNSTGCEIIKNLVLPGVGHVTIVDDQKVTKDDIRSNFFLGSDSTDLPKARCAAELLQELNEDVKVEYVEKSPGQLIENDIDFFEPFTIIITINLTDNHLTTLASFCHNSSKTLIAGESKGLVGYFSIQAPEHRIIETHPENITDLRLNCPFQQLSDYVATFDLDSLDQTDHSQVPFVVILLKYVELWKSEHEGQSPQTYQQRQEFIKLLRADMRTPEEENFEEAISNVWRLASTTSIPSELRRLFEDSSCQNAHDNSPYFWILTRAVRDFVENEGQGQLPLSGKLPDMKSDTCNYIGLQKVYREKALSDFNAIKERVKGFNVQIPDETIELFCKNASNVRVIQYKILNENQLSPEKLVNLAKNEENFCYYIIFKAADKFKQKYGYLPSSIEDLSNLKQQAHLLMVGDMDVSTKDTQEELLKSDTFDKVLTNYIHFGDLETPNLAALVGGLAAQEAIKLITHQYIPINNTCVFNGISSTSSIYEL
ncbi:MAG: NEDD8-activating enzyme E1 regulatory subunit-like protein [Benjaminiella poitrasii]|nr:MAG: NEDD8-activating enzyme E1 regulatory subunit-like protein [Benjaminiella poitrasii]